ncbi:MAG TPA: hypothetical protein VFP66_02200 [Candidatus Limnocylindrales bacterium]|nr:hypothetical protein [Candidatus Limnocylindrales bacterium]
MNGDVQPSLADRARCELGPRLDAGPLEDSAEVRLDRPSSHTERGADLVIRETVSDEADHIDLARRQLWRPPIQATPDNELAGRRGADGLDQLSCLAGRNSCPPRWTSSRRCRSQRSSSAEPDAGTGTELTYTEHGAFLDGLDDPELRKNGSSAMLDELGRWLDRQAATA